MRRLFVAFALLLAACATGANAQSAAPGERAATIQDVAWLAGRWVGEGFGGQLEEVWTAPAGNQMVGHFRMVENGQPSFYEFVLIEEVDGRLRYRVKHFNPDLVGWEEKDAFHEFAFVGIGPNEVRFDGLILRRRSEEDCDHVLMMRGEDGNLHEETLHYRRASE